MGAAGTSIGRTYLGVPRMIPVAGTNRSLGKLLRRDLSILYGDSWWDARVHPWVFCSFDKTLTALDAGRHCREPIASVVRYRWRLLMGAPSLRHYHDHCRSDGAPDPRFYLCFPSAEEPRAIVRRAHYIRTTEAMGFVRAELGFVGAAPPSNSAATVVLDAICLRAKEASAISERMQTDARAARRESERLRGEECCDRDGAIDAEARARRLEHLVFVAQLWTDQMLDLAYWMQQNAAVRARGYTDAPDLDRSATLLLYPHGRRFVSLNDAPDLVPWLPYASACQERQYWAPTGGCGGVSVSEVHTSGKKPGAGGQPESMTTTSTTTTSTSCAQMGMPALAHMVLTKSLPQPCAVRNLDEIASGKAAEDPPVGLATMDAVHAVLMGNYEGCRRRPGFAQRMQIRVASLVFRGATRAEVCGWMREHYWLLHLVFKVWYTEAVDQSPAYKAFVSDVQHHKEFAELTREASDQIRIVLDTTLRRRLPPERANVSRILDDAAHMNHGESLTAFGKLRKGSFVEMLCGRLKNWLRGCGRDRDLPQQYREEIAQMVVLSKITHSLPEYGAYVRSEIEARREEGGPWALGAPLSDLPVSVIESFLKWDGDSAMSVSPWFADRSFFLTAPYRWIDEDTLAAIDLAAWMCARRVDGRFVLSWLRFPIGISPETYQRLINLYFSYECCDVADNSFFVNLRRVLFRRRRRIITAAEYEARIARKDPTIVHERTEVVKRFVATAAGPPILTPIYYHVLEEFGTEESRRDFAILYEYTNRIVAYQSWGTMPLPRRVTEHQIEAVKRRQTIEPWRRTDTELLGARHLCVCGRWASEAVTPPMRPVTSSVTERRGTLLADPPREGEGDAPSYNVVPTRRVPSQSAVDAKTREGAAGSVARLDASDMRTIVSSLRWVSSDLVRRGDPPGGEDVVMDEGSVVSKLVVGIHRPVLPEMAEPVTRDVHPSAASRDIGEAGLGHDLEHPGRLVSKEHAHGPYCADQQLYRINLLGRAVRPKGPKAPRDGPWYTICATCGSLTTIDLGRWDHRGPSCGAHGRPHRLPDRRAPYDPSAGHHRVAAGVAEAIRRDLSRLYADSYLPAPDDVIQCWYDHQPCDVRPVAAARDEEAPLMLWQEASSDPLVRVRYEAGTSVATAAIGSTGAALHARNTTVRGTNQAPPVRRMLVRGAIFADLGRSLLVDRTCPIYRRRPAGKRGIAGGVLPSEILPVAGEEITLKVFDDVHRGDGGEIMRLRWIYLCPIHVKDLRKGWVSLWGRLVQIQKQKEAARGGAFNTTCSMAERTVLDNAASGKRVGTEAIVKHLFSRVHRLSDIRRAIEKGHRTRVRKDIRFGREIDMAMCPDFTESRRRWSEQH